jgi:hypothetical protein
LRDSTERRRRSPPRHQVHQEFAWRSWCAWCFFDWSVPRDFAIDSERSFGDVRDSRERTTSDAQDPSISFAIAPWHTVLGSAWARDPAGTIRFCRSLCRPAGRCRHPGVRASALSAVQRRWLLRSGIHMRRAGNHLCVLTDELRRLCSVRRVPVSARFVVHQPRHAVRLCCPGDADRDVRADRDDHADPHRGTGVCPGDLHRRAGHRSVGAGHRGYNCAGAATSTLVFRLSRARTLGALGVS